MSSGNPSNRLVVIERAPSNVVAGPNAGVLCAINNDRVGLALWWRKLCPGLAKAASDMLAGSTFSCSAVGEPRLAMQELLRAVPLQAAVLGSDIERLANLFSELGRSSVIRLRLEHGRPQTLRRLHLDATRLRMLCTYAGPGIEWQDGQGTVRRMPEGHVAFLKGTRWLAYDKDALVLHRSPTPANSRHMKDGWLLLCIDQPNLN